MKNRPRLRELLVGQGLSGRRGRGGFRLRHGRKADKIKSVMSNKIMPRVMGKSVTTCTDSEKRKQPLDETGVSAQEQLPSAKKVHTSYFSQPLSSFHPPRDLLSRITPHHSCANIRIACYTAIIFLLGRLISAPPRPSHFFAAEGLAMLPSRFKTSLAVFGVTELIDTVTGWLNFIRR